MSDIEIVSIVLISKSNQKRSINTFTDFLNVHVPKRYWIGGVILFMGLT